MMIFPSAEPHYNTGVTVELREIVENGVDLWAFDYPSFYEGDYKTAFERKVVDHYYFRQIGQETVGRFLHCFRSKVREIMPYYVDLYKTVLLYNEVKDPFENVDMVEELTQTRQTTGTTSNTSERSTTSTGTTSNTSERSTTSTGTTSSSSERSATSTGTSSNEFESEKIGSENVETENTRKFSNTPQGEIADLDYYLTEATVENGKQDTGNNETVTQSTSGTSSATDTATQSDEASAESTNSEEQTINGSSETTNSENQTNNGSSEGSETLTNRFTRKGNHGVDTFAKVLKEHRSAIINIDMMIIEELGDLFLKVY